MSNRLTINKAANILGVSTKTLRRWEELGFFTPQRDPNTNIRLYHPYLVDYWKKLLDTNRELTNHLRKLDPVRKELEKHLAMKPLGPNDKLPMLDFEGFSKAHQEMEKWEKDYDRLMKAFFEFPTLMQQAILKMEEEE